MRHQKQQLKNCWYWALHGRSHAASSRALKPELFERLILIDPTFLPFEPLSGYQTTSLVLSTEKFTPWAPSAYRRRDARPSKEAAFESFRKKKLFRSISDQGLWDYVNAVMIKTTTVALR